MTDKCLDRAAAVERRLAELKARLSEAETALGAVEKEYSAVAARLQKAKGAVFGLKRDMNRACKDASMPPMFIGEDLAPVENEDDLKGLFHALPLLQCVQLYLAERQRLARGPASIESIGRALEQGGFDLSTLSEKGDQEQKRILAIKLARNPQMFVKLKNSLWTLAGDRKAAQK